MVTRTEKGVTYWLAGHQVYAEMHVVPVTAKDVYEDDGAIQGTIDLAGVSTEFRSMIDRNSDTASTVIHKEDLYATRREAVEALAVQLMQEEIKFEVAKQALRTQFALAASEEEAAEKASRPYIRQRKKG